MKPRVKKLRVKKLRHYVKALSPRYWRITYPKSKDLDYWYIQNLKQGATFSGFEPCVASFAGTRVLLYLPPNFAFSRYDDLRWNRPSRSTIALLEEALEEDRKGVN